MSRRIDEPVPTLISVVRRTAALMVDELVRRLAVAGYPDITPSEHLVFENLPPGGARVTELAARAGMSHQAAGELVGALASRGYLERRPDTRDGRARLVVLTTAGRRLVRTALREIAEIEQEWARALVAAGWPGELGPALDAAGRRAEAWRVTPASADGAGG